MLSNKNNKFNSRQKKLGNEDNKSTLVSWVTLSSTLETTIKRITREPTIPRKFSHFQSTQLFLTTSFSQIKEKMSLKKLKISLFYNSGRKIKKNENK